MFKISNRLRKTLVTVGVSGERLKDRDLRAATSLQSPGGVQQER